MSAEAQWRSSPILADAAILISGGVIPVRLPAQAPAAKTARRWR